MERRCESDLTLSERDILEDWAKELKLLRSFAEESGLLLLAGIYVWPGEKEQDYVMKGYTMRRSCLCGIMPMLKIIEELTRGLVDFYSINKD